MKKLVVEGYIARTDDLSICFSNKPMEKSGFWGDGDVWYDTLHTEEEFPLELRVDMHQYIDIPELTFENSPRHCKITIEVGEQVQGNDQKEIEHRTKAERIKHYVNALAAESAITFEEAAEIHRKFLQTLTNI